MLEANSGAEMRHKKQVLNGKEVQLKKKLRALATGLKRNIREAEAKAINNMFSKEPSMVYK